MNGDTENVIGTIQLTHATSLVFSVRPWKGRMLAHVRKFVSGGRYEGPTKAGLTMGGEVLVSVASALTRLKSEAPGVEERQFAKVRKGADTEIVISIVPPDDLKALPSVDVREYVDSESYTGPTKKGVRFSWDKLSEFIGLLEVQAQSLGESAKSEPVLFPEAHPGWVKQAEKANTGKKPDHDAVVKELLPKGPKDFPSEFLEGVANTTLVEMPDEPVSVVALRGDGHAVSTGLGFNRPVRNPIEGNFLYYAHLRGHRKIRLPQEMISVFRAVKAYENYLRELRHALVQEYERRSGHRPLAEHQAKEVFRRFGLPWVDNS